MGTESSTETGGFQFMELWVTPGGVSAREVRNVNSDASNHRVRVMFPCSQLSSSFPLTPRPMSQMAPGG